MGSKLDNLIDKWKSLLLDFGKRNRLINYKEGKRSNIRFTLPSYNLIYDLFVTQEKEIILPYLKNSFEKTANNNWENKYEIIKGDVETSVSVSELQITLKNLRNKAKTSIEERGVNILYLTFGLLKWTEQNNSNEFFLSPLILVPAKISIESLASPYKLTLHEDEIVVNPTLIQKIYNDYSIIIPEFDSAQDNIELYFDKIEEIIGNKGWTIDRCVNLTTLSFLKINMYKDLERNSEKLHNNIVITALAGEHEPIRFPEELNNYDHDSKTKPIDTFQVVDADSSQQDAILLSKHGTSFVLQGPPGTGKSQTITNIISEALADGKKVLFVSEKMAALQVVYNRLSNVGLSEYCLTLHSHKANKKLILNELANAIHINRKKVRREALMQLDILEKKRNELNEYQKELHTPCSSLQKTIFDINGELAKLADAPDFIFEINDVETITEQQLLEREYLLNEFTKTIKNTNDVSTNVWKGAAIPYLSNRLIHDIDAIITHIVPILRNIETILSNCIKELEISTTESIEGLDKTIELLNIASKSTFPLKKWIYECSIEDLKQRLHSQQSINQVFTSIKNTIIQNYDRKLLDIDYYPILQRFRTSYSTVFRWFNKEYRADINHIKSYSNKEFALSYDKAFELLNSLNKYHEYRNLFFEEEQKMVSLYERFYTGENTDWNIISESINYSIELKELINKYDISDSLVNRICEDKATIDFCKKCHISLIQQYETIKGDLNQFFSMFENPDSLRNYSINKLIEYLLECKDKKHQLEEWIDYKNCRKKCKTAGLSSFIQQIEKNSIEPNMIVASYFKRFYRLWLDSVLPNFPAVLNFRSNNHQDCINDFCQLDINQFCIAQARVRERIVSKIPDFNTITSASDEIGILKRELNKQRKLMPLRKLFMNIPNLLTTLKPCFMMSPLSVSVFLEAKSYDFDLVIFDEASQIHTEDAIGAIMRGKQVIIVGDRKQLPPTNFFSATMNDDNYDIADEEQDYDTNSYESILDETEAVLPERSLRWHYRSRHENLIAFSNAKIYNNNLITFPSTINNSPDFGVEYIFVANGIYDRGGKRNNIEEAKRVADLVFEHFKKYPNRSLGVVTFSESQQDAVEMAIRERRQKNHSFENFFIEDKEDSFFIKNLENVQGDERDTIIISIGYAKDNRGIMYLNFGPLNKDGGYRRLNVAITRAKYNVKLVGSIMPTDINIDNISSEGIKLLRSYIEFAQQGIIALQKELSYDTTPCFDSPFEESVYDFLISNGYDVVTQVGCSGFRIDMAIKHPKHSGKFAIGIECDGATYHSSRTVRERDRLRQTVLEDMGWTIYRIWSTNWIKNIEEEKKKLINAIQIAFSECRLESKNTYVDSIPIIEIEEEMNNYYSNNHNNDFIEYKYAQIEDLLNLSKTDAIKKIIEIEQPIHINELFHRAAPLYGNIKATQPIRDQILCEIQLILRDKVKMDENYYITLNSFVFSKPRKSTNKARNCDHISPKELIEALKIVIKRSFGITPDNLIKVTAKELGYKRISLKTQFNIEQAYRIMLRDKIAQEVEGKVYLVKK